MMTTTNGSVVSHFLNFLTDEEKERFKDDGLERVPRMYRLAVNKARYFDGKEYRGKQYGGGIAFRGGGIARQTAQLLSTERTNNAIILLQQAEELFRKSAQAGVAYANTGWKKKHENELSFANQAEQILIAVFPSIKVDYPGLYPSFEIKGNHHYTIKSLIVHELKPLKGDK